MGAAAVLAVPLGVLRSGSISFDPPLPAWKSSALSRMAVGCRVRVVMEFDRAFWKGHAEIGAAPGTCPPGTLLMGVLPDVATASDGSGASTCSQQQASAEPAPFAFQALGSSPALLAGLMAGWVAEKVGVATTVLGGCSTG